MIYIIAQAVIIKNNKILMVRQYVQRGDIVWNFPGGGIEQNESPEAACIREIKEETGLDARGLTLIHKQDEKYTYLIHEVKGRIRLDKMNKDNDDLLEVKWIDRDDHSKFDTYTKPILEWLESGLMNRSKRSTDV